MGRKPIEWSERDADQFKSMCSIFCTKAEVCVVMGVDPKTLDRLIAVNFPDTPTWDEAFEAYSAGGKANLRRRQFQAAMDGDRTMLIWLGKNYLGQSDEGAEGHRKAAVDAQPIARTALSIVRARSPVNRKAAACGA